MERKICLRHRLEDGNVNDYARFRVSQVDDSGGGFPLISAGDEYQGME
jgi:hypothetical protein